MTPTNPERWRSIDDLYRAALERPAGERAAFLQEACADEKVRGEVASLLGWTPAGDRLMEQSPWAAPSTLGPYKVGERIGAGGMGEVYRARDSRLGRDVAIKVLPPGMTGDPDRRARFMREAQSASRLNHPNIVTIYDVGESDGRVYIGMEYVAGKTLDAVIPRGGLPWAAAVKYAIPIASALAKAHSAGIIHRDLKPGNVMVTAEGVVKVLDFGLAKIVDARLEQADETRTAALETQSGVVMGTPAFMSPEQAEGKTLDARSDIFSFGAVLYEMIAGKRAFPGDSMAATLAAVLHKEAEPLPPSRPRELRKIVARCLRKDPERRFQSMADARVALMELQEQGADEESVAAAPRSRRLPFALAAVGIAVIALAAGYFLSRAPAAPEWSSAALGGPDGALHPRLSPDGRTLAFVAFVAGQTQVALMRPGSGNWLVLTRNRERGSVTAVSWSPDGNKIYYDRTLDVPRGIYSVAVLGGEEQLILEDAMYPEALPDGSLIVARFNPQHELQLFHYWPESGRLQPLPMQIDLLLFTSQVRSFPDGREALVVGGPVGQPLDPGRDIYIMDVASGQTRRVVNRSHGFQIGAPGVSRDGRSILFAEGGPFQFAALSREGSSPARVMFPLTSLPWAADTGSDGSIYTDLTNRPISLVRFSPSGGRTTDIAHFPFQDYDAQFAVLPDGRAVWKEQTGDHGRLVFAEQGKDTVPLSGAPDETSFPVTRAGANDIAFALGKDRRTIGIASIATGRIARRIPFDKGTLSTMLGSPDGQSLYCTVAGSIWIQPTAGGPAKRMRAGAAVAMDPAGEFVVVVDTHEGRTRLMKVPVAGGAEREVPILGNSRPAPVSTGSIDRQGRLLLGLQSPDSWFIQPAVIDLATGRVTRIDVDSPGDKFHLAWTPDGQIMAAVLSMHATLWKFQPQVR